MPKGAIYRVEWAKDIIDGMQENLAYTTAVGILLGKCKEVINKDINIRRWSRLGQ